MEVEISWWT